MEWALAIPHEQAFGRLLGPGDGEVVFKRLYFGEEFCEKALSTRSALKKAMGGAEEYGWEFTYVTPYVTENGLTKIKERLAILAQGKPNAEVVINDWGVLEWVSQHHPTLTPVLGRLMNKIIRDPRMPKHLKNSTVQTPMHQFQGSSLAGEGMKGLLDQYQVRRIELDYPPQGLDDDLPAWGYDISLYFPFGVITTGRICLMQSWGLHEKDKFKTTGECYKNCKIGWIELSDPSGQVEKTKDWKIIQKGNTIFYRHGEGSFKRIMSEMKRLGINRIIVQPEPI